jgi:hypothetical protein
MMTLSHHNGTINPERAVADDSISFSFYYQAFLIIYGLEAPLTTVP